MIEKSLLKITVERIESENKRILFLQNKCKSRYL